MNKSLAITIALIEANLDYLIDNQKIFTQDLLDFANQVGQMITKKLNKLEDKQTIH